MLDKYIEVRYIIGNKYIEVRYNKLEESMKERLKRIYIPMTETGFYILFCLQEEMHGYNIVQKVKQMTLGEIEISPGTMYGSLSKMERDELIQFIKEQDNRKYYCITPLGKEILNTELKRIERIYHNSKGEDINEKI